MAVHSKKLAHRYLIEGIWQSLPILFACVVFSLRKHEVCCDWHEKITLGKGMLLDVLIYI